VKKPLNLAATAGGVRLLPAIFPPIAATCRAMSVAGNTLYSCCLSKANTSCCYRIRLSSLRVCLHPHHLEIVRRTAG